MKAYTLILLLAVSVFPFSVFCHSNSSHQFDALSYSQQSDYHDCPFCSFHFSNEFDQTDDLSFSSESRYIDILSFNLEKQANSFSLNFKNKGPPSVFL